VIEADAEIQLGFAALRIAVKVELPGSVSEFVQIAPDCPFPSSVG
jgi:hypothetical protein